MEYWAHEACFLPAAILPRFAIVCLPGKMGWKYRQAWMHEHAAEIEQLIAHIAEKGPVRSADFEHPRKGQAAGGNGSRTSAISKGCLHQAR